MRINGFQKLTLLDFPGRVACIVFTPGCNFRCPFCHNASLVTHIGQDTVSEEDVFSYLKKRKGLLDGVCITGGEPLLQPDLEAFVREVRGLGYAVKLDTNGSNPQKLIHLVSQGLLDYVAMDIKNSRAKYALTAGVPDLQFEPIEQSIAFLLEDHVDYEFRTTVASGLHTPEDIASAAQLIRGAKRYFLQNFVDSGDILSEGLTPVSQEKMEKMCQEAQKYVPVAQIRSSK